MDVWNDFSNWISEVPLTTKFSLLTGPVQRITNRQTCPATFSRWLFATNSHYILLNAPYGHHGYVFAGGLCRCCNHLVGRIVLVTRRGWWWNGPQEDKKPLPRFISAAHCWIGLCAMPWGSIWLGSRGAPSPSVSIERNSRVFNPTFVPSLHECHRGETSNDCA